MQWDAKRLRVLELSKGSSRFVNGLELGVCCVRCGV